MRNAIIGPSFGLAIAWIAESAGAMPPRAELEMLARAFDDSALRAEDTLPEPLIKWTGPLYYTARNARAQRSVERQLLSSIREIAGLAGLRLIEVADDDRRANVVARLHENEASSGSNTCFALWSRGSDGALQRVEININFRLWRQIERCIVHEALHGFGFPSHAHAADSVLSYVSSRSALTKVDHALIRTLYDRRLAPGTAPAAASRTACRILGETIGAAPADIAAVCAARPGPRRSEAGLTPKWLPRSHPASR
jgi:hypothetical protein